MGVGVCVMPAFLQELERRRELMRDRARRRAEEVCSFTMLYHTFICYSILSSYFAILSIGVNGCRRGGAIRQCTGRRGRGLLP